MLLRVIALLLFLSVSSLVSGIPCVLKPFNSGLVCVCNSTYCDTLEYKNPPKTGDVVIISTSKDGLRFHETHAKFGGGKHLKIENGPYYFGSSSENGNDFNIQAQVMKVVKQIEGIEEPINAIVNIEVNRTEKFQEVIGFGGAFTGSVSYILKLMNKELQDHVYKGYYSHEVGIGYNMMRYPIGGCDFDLAPWAYHEKPEHDPYLSNFTSLDERDIEKIAQIHDLKKVSKNDDIRLIGSAWSPPKWMKTNNDWTGFSALRDEYYQTWANYHVKFLELMAKHDNPFWAITTGNEPMNGVLFQHFVKFMSLGWDPDSQGKWVANNLGPTMKASPVAKNVKILGGDDQRYTLPIWFERMHKGNENSTNFIDGLAFHWYADKMVPASLLNEAANIYPDKFLISTEACSGDRPWDVHGPLLGSWGRFEDYTLDIIEDLNHFVSAWVDWNLVLDEEGGPNYVRNTVDAAMILKGTEIYKQPIFYALGHFSRFILPGSVRIKSKPSNRYVKAVSFLRPDGYIVVILYNIAEHNMHINIFDKQHGILRVEVPAKSLHTLMYK